MIFWDAIQATINFLLALKNMKIDLKSTLIYFFWGCSLLAVTILSYTLVDLNLTISQSPLYVSVQSYLTHIGYFNRPLNALIWTVFLLLATLFYLFFLFSAYYEKIRLKLIIKCIAIAAVILLFAYNIFSYDLFNYIFDARILTRYGQNPYLHKALDYPDDQWIRFMRWTHRSYPYGPGWIIITLIPSFLGLGLLLPTLFLFKMTFVAIYLLTLLVLYKLISLITEQQKLRNTALVSYAFHPLVLTETIISPHLDSFMIMLMFWALYLFFAKKSKIYSIFIMILSVSIKFATVFLLPIYIFKKASDIDNPRTIYLIFLLTAAAAFAQSVNRTIQPWYFLLPLSAVPLFIPFAKIKLALIILLILILPLFSYWNIIFKGLSFGIIDFTLF